ncbi:MAG: TraR/DksA family transcriptional regulator [Planctomycetota bacterium]|nr:TraR/DksA family transcriptional regulator [Planctomycetota bacterium]MDA1178980.1 TraR/DksA family transcriptional regulator [Planctomycetota bacterium]
MSNSTLANCKRQLEAKLLELTDRAERIENRLSDPGGPDWKENAALHTNDEVLSALSDLTEHDIHEIKLALSRIDAGTYGTCVDCSRPITQARLSALPFTTQCVDCAQRH